MGNDPVNMADPSGGSIFSGLDLGEQVIVGAMAGFFVGMGAAALTGNDEDAWRWASYGAIIGGGIPLLGSINLGSINPLIKHILISTTTTAVYEVFNSTGKGQYETQFKEKKVKDDLYTFRRKHFKSYNGPARGMTTSTPSGYTKEGKYFKDKDGKKALGVTRTQIFQIGKKKVTKSSIHFAEASFHSPETLFNVMGHEMAHLQINIDETANNYDYVSQDQHHHAIYIWQYKLAINMKWNSLANFYFNELMEFQNVQTTMVEDWMKKSLAFLPMFYK